MFRMILKWLVFAGLIMFTAWIIPGITVDNFWSAMIAVVIIALVNTFIKPFVQFVSLPVTFLTLGLFSLVINALLLMLVGVITPGLQVDGFLSAFLGSLLLSLFAGIVNEI